MNGMELISLLQNYIPSAIEAVAGGLISAIFLRYNTASEEFEKIKAEKFKEVAEDLLKSGKMTYTEFYKANNFLKIAKKADKYYSERSHDVRADKYDFDWFVRFYETVGNISDEKMQDIWAKILAGEINCPSAYSLRTIDVLKNISKDEADLFCSACVHSFSSGVNFFLPNNNSYLEHCGITYRDVMLLSEYGLIYNDDNIVIEKNFSQKMEPFVYSEHCVLCVASKDKEVRTVSIKQFPFTKVGRELARVIGKISAYKDDLIVLEEEFRKNQSISVRIDER